MSFVSCQMFVVASWSKAPLWLIPSLGTALRAQQSRAPRAGKVSTRAGRLCAEVVIALRCQLGGKWPGRDQGVVGRQQWVPSREGKSPQCPLQACRSRSSEKEQRCGLQPCNGPQHSPWAWERPPAQQRRETSLESQERGRHRARLQKMSHPEGWRQQTLG